MENQNIGMLSHLMQLMQAETDRKRANEIALLKYEVDFFKERAQEEQARNVELKQKKAAQEAEKLLLKKQSTAVENGTDENVRQCNEFTDKINRTQYSITELKQTMQQESEEFDQFCANFEKEMEKKKMLNQKIINEHKALKLKSIVAERKYRQQIVGFEAEKFSIVEKVAKTEQIIKEFQAKELNILDEIQNVKQRHEVDKSAWKDKYVAMETKKNAIENDLSAERLKCDAANLKLSDLKTDNDYFQATIKELKDEISKLDENHDVVTAENEQIQKKIGDVQTQVEELEKSTAELLITNKEQLKETGSLEAKAKHLEEVLAELTTEKNKGQSVKQTARAPLEINATIADDVASVDKPIVHSSQSKRLSSAFSPSGSKSRGKKQSLASTSANADASKRSANVAGRKAMDTGLKRLPSPGVSTAGDDLDTFMNIFLFGDDNDVDVDTRKFDDTYDNLLNPASLSGAIKKNKNK